jgi:hypothetical protein
MKSGSNATMFRPSPSPSYQELEKLIASRLNGRVRAFQLVLETDGLVLHGYCISYHAKQVAQHLVMEMSTLPILANEIEVMTRNEP